MNQTAFEFRQAEEKFRDRILRSDGKIVITEDEKIAVVFPREVGIKVWGALDFLKKIGQIHVAIFGERRVNL